MWHMYHNDEYIVKWQKTNKQVTCFVLTVRQDAAQQGRSWQWDAVSLYTAYPPIHRRLYAGKYTAHSAMYQDYDSLSTAVSSLKKKEMWEEEYAINYLCQWMEVVKNTKVIKSQMM